MTKVLLAGSYDPITNGHLALVRTCASLFSQVHVVSFLNADKTVTYSADRRLAMLTAACEDIPGTVVATDDGMVVDYARRNGIRILVRGVRGEADLPYEMEMARNNHAYDPDVTTFFLPADASLQDVSSSEVRRRLAAGEDISHLVPPAVAALMAEYERAK